MANTVVRLTRPLVLPERAYLRFEHGFALAVPLRLILSELIAGWEPQSLLTHEFTHREAARQPVGRLPINWRVHHPRPDAALLQEVLQLLAPLDESIDEPRCRVLQIVSK